MWKNLTIFTVKYLWSCCILHSCQVLGGKWLVWFGLLRVVPYNTASLATVYLGRANSFMVLFVLTAVHPLKSQPSTAWYCIQLDNGEGITQVRLKCKKENPASRLWVVCLIWFWCVWYDFCGEKWPWDIGTARYWVVFCRPISNMVPFLWGIEGHFVTVTGEQYVIYRSRHPVVCVANINLVICI